MADEKRVFIDVVNSVKGGSGKSTFSLLLAAAYSKEENVQAFILDLDLRGTSWEPNYGFCMYNNVSDQARTASLRTLSNGATEDDQQQYKTYPFINSLMWNPKNIQRNENVWSELKCDTDQFGKISICPAKAQDGGDIDKIEIDIFENTIKEILISTMTNALFGDIRDIHFILDMPPSYEKHAERIVKHLLTSQDSELFKLAQQKEGVFGIFKPYIVTLYMICAISPAHVMQNSLYINSLLEKPSYSNSTSKLIEDHRFFVRFVLNDVSNMLHPDIQEPGNPIQGDPAASIDDFGEMLMLNEPFYKHFIDWFGFPKRNLYPKPSLWLILNLKLNGTLWYFIDKKDSPSKLEVKNAFMDQVDRINKLIYVREDQEGTQGES